LKKLIYRDRNERDKINYINNMNPSCKNFKQLGKKRQKNVRATYMKDGTQTDNKYNKNFTIIIKELS